MTAVTFSVEIHTRHLSIVSAGQTLTTRSKGLLAFACCLLWKKRQQPDAAWVGIDELRRILPTTHGKQIQRYLDTLAEIHFPVEYESKTRGRYCLALPAEQVRVDVGDSGLEKFIGLRTAPPAISGKAGALEENQLLLDSLSRINLADSQFYDGNLDAAAGHAYDIWRRECDAAPPELRGIALLKFAKVCRRLSRHDEALTALRKLGKLLHLGMPVHAGLEIKFLLCKAMTYYEQGKLAEARAIVDKLDVRGCSDMSALGEYYNLMGLLAYREMRTRNRPAVEPEALAALLEITVHYYRQALVLHASVGDYQAQESTCFNLGNAFLYAWREGFPTAERNQFLELGVKWIGQCEFICHKFGVGMDSTWSRIVLIKSALHAGIGLDELNGLTNGLFKSYANLEELAQATLAEATRIGNRREQAEILMALIQFAQQRLDFQGAAQCRQEALAIYRELNRPDLSRLLKSRFPETNS